jgi:hypothetical protein
MLKWKVSLRLARVIDQPATKPLPQRTTKLSKDYVLFE